MSEPDKLFRWLGAWFFWAIGDIVSRLELDSFTWGFNLYQWSMSASVKCQGLYGFKKWPWSEPQLWEKAE
jgi:hypothetical protein